jgi:hypothetical protein
MSNRTSIAFLIVTLIVTLLAGSGCTSPPSATASRLSASAPADAGATGGSSTSKVDDHAEAGTAKADPYDAGTARLRAAELERAAAIRGQLESGDEAAPVSFRWLDHPAEELLVERIDAPDGFRRIAVEPGSFGDWLRHLPLKPAGSKVLLHTGEPKARQDVHVAVFDVDVGRRDRQQCADAVMRLRAEYLWAAGRAREICFKAVSGKKLRWRGGSSRKFRNYLGGVFAIANSASLLKELETVEDRARVEPGDVFIVPAEGGVFGHAVTVMDVAVDEAGQRVYLLSQSYMPAQEIHLLKNPRDDGLSPWYLVRPEATLYTPEWTFAPDTLRRFPERTCGG